MIIVASHVAGPSELHSDITILFVMILFHYYEIVQEKKTHGNAARYRVDTRKTKFSIECTVATCRRKFKLYTHILYKHIVPPHTHMYMYMYFCTNYMYLYVYRTLYMFMH